MTRKFRLVAVEALAVLFSVSACSSSASDGSATPSAGSTSTTGGSSGVGGASSQGGSTNGGTSNSAAGSAAAAAVPEGDGQAFVPSAIHFNSLGDTGPMALTVLSATVRDYGDFIGLMAAVRNDLATPVCYATFNAEFETATNVAAGRASLALASAMYLVDGAAEPCLGVGEVGYGGGVVSFDTTTQFSEITSLDYEPQGTIFPTIGDKITTVRLSQITVLTPAAGGQTLGGSMTNNGTTPLTNVSASYFALDSGGRPYDFDGAQTDNPLEPRATWAFSFPNESTIGKYVAFASYATPQ